MAIDWLFFDVGRVLMDEAPGIRAYRAWASRVLRESLPVSVWEDIETELQANGMMRALERFRPDLTLDERGELAAALWELGADPHMFHASPPADGILAVTEDLRTRFRLGIIANQHRGIHGWLARHHLEPLFEVRALSCDLGFGKPDPRIFAWALERANCPPSRAVMLGDRLDNDIAPAKALGMWAVHVRALGGFLDEPSSEAEMPHAVADTIADIPKAVECVCRMADQARDPADRSWASPGNDGDVLL